jgi:DNA-directed RNA polymerase subunit RPC12/RpoP
MPDLSNASFGVYAPSLQATLLPRCPDCGGKHPLAYQPPLPAHRCPDCGSPRDAAPAPVDVPAVVTDGRTKLGIAMMRFGTYLKRISERL